MPARIGAWTRSALRDLAYCGAVCVWSVAAFAILVSGVSVTAPLLILVIGVIVWIGFVYVMRWATFVDRGLAGWRRRERVRGLYHRPPAPGVLPLLRALSSDPQTWKDLGWLAVAPVAGFSCGLAVVTAAGMAFAFVTMPAWYWAVSDPQHEYGVTNLGLFTVDTIREALAASAIGLAMIPMVLLVASIMASLYSRLAVHVLAPSGSLPAARPFPPAHAPSRLKEAVMGVALVSARRRPGSQGPIHVKEDAVIAAGGVALVVHVLDERVWHPHIGVPVTDHLGEHLVTVVLTLLVVVALVLWPSRLPPWPRYLGVLVVGAVATASGAMHGLHTVRANPPVPMPAACSPELPVPSS